MMFESVLTRRQRWSATTKPPPTIRSTAKPLREC